MARTASIERKTKETNISLSVNLDGNGEREIDTPVPFLNHMLEQIAVHGKVDLKIKASGDVEIDYHHTVEDIGICLGQAFEQALGDKAGISRYGNFSVPLDEALSRAVVDFCGRPYFVYRNEPIRPGRIGDFDVELVPEFFQAFANHARANVHIIMEYGENRHHLVEASFKAFARAIRAAIAVEGGGVASSKGAL